MKAVLNLDQGADMSVLPPEYQDKIRFYPDRSAYFPKGTEFEGDHALELCKTGQASPADDECSKALGRSPAQQRIDARKYLAAVAGIKGAKDMELFMAGVIEGYDKGTTDEEPKYLPGPNWDKWQEAKAKIAASEDEE